MTRADKIVTKIIKYLTIALLAGIAIQVWEEE